MRQIKGLQAARVTTVALRRWPRHKVGLSRSQFALVLGVSVRTLQEWEQGRRNLTSAAQRLICIAARHPEVLIEELEARA